METQPTLNQKKGFRLNYTTLNWGMLLVMLIIEVIVFSNLTPYFLHLNNLLPVGREIATLGIVAIGQTMCILTGGFDLSVGGVAAISGVVAGVMCSPKMLDLPFVVGFPIAIAVALAVGMTNGFLITKVKINPFITTMAMNFILGGAVILITKQPITINKPDFKFLGATTFGDIKFPLPIIILVGLYLLFFFILKYTVFGRKLYCTGGNSEAAKVAGISVEKTIFFTYTFSSLLAGFAGIMLASRIATANPGIGSSYALESIAATVLGGTALSGGEGNIWGAFLGVFVTGLLSNGLIMIGAPQAWRDIATGLVLILAIILQLSSKKSRRLAG
ncbi:sugar ABC transporter permease [Clostridia bacterium]|nr:sugar ABC transporter permease [Clostridia bacterium]